MSPDVAFSGVMEEGGLALDVVVDVIALRIPPSDCFRALHTPAATPSAGINQKAGFASALGRQVVPIVRKQERQGNVGIIQSNMSTSTIVERAGRYGEPAIALPVENLKRWFYRTFDNHVRTWQERLTHY